MNFVTLDLAMRRDDITTSHRTSLTHHTLAHQPDLGKVAGKDLALVDLLGVCIGVLVCLAELALLAV